MTLVVEDGTGLPNANAYISVAYANEYFASRGNAAWAAITDEATKENAIINATEYLDVRWVFSGDILNEEQALSFPRIDLPRCARGATFPEPVKKATAEYAVRALTGPLAPDPSVDPSGFAVKRKKEKVGPIEEETELAAGSGWAALPASWVPYPWADALLSCFITGSNNARNGRTIRA